MKQSNVTELKIFIENILNESISPCQEKLLEYLVDNDRSIGFIRMTNGLIDSIGYLILWDIIQNDIDKIYINLGDYDFNNQLFNNILKIIKDNELYDDLGITEHDIQTLDDLIIMNDIMITTDDNNLNKIDKYYIFDLFNDDQVTELVDSLIDDKQQSFVLMDTITKHIILDNKYNNILNSFIYTITYSDYHNCNSEVIQTLHKG